MGFRVEGLGLRGGSQSNPVPLKTPRPALNIEYSHGGILQPRDPKLQMNTCIYIYIHE